MANQIKRTANPRLNSLQMNLFNNDDSLMTHQLVPALPRLFVFAARNIKTQTTLWFLAKNNGYTNINGGHHCGSHQN